jgi:hypothetical protein
MAESSIPSDADDAARARDAAEEQARLLYVAALAYVATHDFGEDPAHDPRLQKAAATLALTLWRAMRRFSKVKMPTGTERQQRLDERAGVLLRRAAEDARAHFRTVEGRLRRTDGDVSAREVAAAVKADKEWAAAAGRTMGTQEYAEAVMEMHPRVEAATGGEPHSKLWISRGDHRVRKTHRKLHGQVEAIGKPFVVSGKDGAIELGYPGDPKAPLGERINCRCVLFLVPTKDKAEAEKVFHIPEDDFDVGKGLAASGVADLLRERAEREWRSELARSYLR